MAAGERSGQMYFAVTDNDPVKLAELIRAGGDVDQFYDDVTNISSKSLLHVCCGRGHVQCLRVFIENGATLDVRDDWGQTPLMYSITIQFPEATQVLLEANPELILGQDRFGKSPLHCAVATGSEELVRLLLRFGADVNVRCHEGLTPLMYCCMADPEGVKVKVLQILLDGGCLVDLTDYRGRRSALHIAVSAGNLRAVESLIAAGADVNAIEKTLRTPLTLAILAGVKGARVDEVPAQIISLLVSAGAQLDITVNESCNPLMTSALLKSEPVVRYFLSLGANPDSKFYSGVTPALVCASTGDLTTLRPLIHYNCSLTTKGNVYKCRRKVEYVLDPFELAYMEGHVSVCRLMVEAGYCVHRLLNSFLNDLQRQNTNSEAGTHTTNSNQQVSLTEGEIPILTFAHAHRPPEDWLESLLWLISKASNARSLREEAVFAVRGFIGRRLLWCVKDLPVPKLVKNYIMLDGLNLDECTELSHGFLGQSNLT